MERQSGRVICFDPCFHEGSCSCTTVPPHGSEPGTRVVEFDPLVGAFWATTSEAIRGGLVCSHHRDDGLKLEVVVSPDA